MPVITLPDGSQRPFDQPISIYDIAADIGAGLAKAALGGVIDGREVDTSYIVESDASVAIITDRDDAGLEIIRHSTAHLLAMATQELFPGAQVTIGPVIEDGFFYDFFREKPFVPEDLEKIEARMKEIAKQDIEIVRQEIPRDEALKKFDEMGESFKCEIIELKLIFISRDQWNDQWVSGHGGRHFELILFKTQTSIQLDLVLMDVNVDVPSQRNANIFRGEKKFNFKTIKLKIIDIIQRSFFYKPLSSFIGFL